MMESMAKECLEPEIIELKRMYGACKELQTVFEIHSARFQQTQTNLSTKIQEVVLQRLKHYGGTKQRLAQLLDEEQQRELEQELEEERQMERPPPVKPCKPILYEEIKRLCVSSGMMNLGDFPNVFRHLVYALIDTTFYNDCQPNSWQQSFWTSTEFQRVIETNGESLNPFLRPPRWIIVYQNQHLIFVNALEANWLIGRLQSEKSSITTLRLLLPRTKRIQSIFVNTRTLTIPSSIGLVNDALFFTISNEWLAQLFIFNGTLYFETVDEQTTYCQCLSLCPKPRRKIEEEAFEKGWIDADGFVSNRKHRYHLQIKQARFRYNPLTFVKEILENRNNAHAPITSHVGSIILNCTKLINIPKHEIKNKDS